MTPRISIIIPARNEADRIERTLEHARAGAPHEIIVVDGGSEDDTLALAAAAGATTMSAPAGRASQMNAGAARATGDVFLFLHADTLLPADYAPAVARALTPPDVVAGAFRLRIDAPGFAFRLVERGVNARSRRRGRPYGDQAPFIRADAFRAIGGFPELPVMEDFAILAPLRRQGRIALADAAVVTSARRWQKRGLWRQTLRHQAMIMGYRLGVRPERLARWRG